MARAAPKVAVGVDAEVGEARRDGDGVLESRMEGEARSAVGDTEGVARARATLAVSIALAEAVRLAGEALLAPDFEGWGGLVALGGPDAEAAPEDVREARGEAEAAAGEGEARVEAVGAATVCVGERVPAPEGTGERLPEGGTEPVVETRPLFDAEVEAVEDWERRGEEEARALARELLEGPGVRESVGAARVAVREAMSSRVVVALLESEEDSDGERVEERERAEEGDSAGERVPERECPVERLAEMEGEPERDCEVDRDARGDRESEREESGVLLLMADRVASA
jgi:hypothetical protein